MRMERECAQHYQHQRMSVWTSRLPRVRYFFGFALLVHWASFGVLHEGRIISRSLFTVLTPSEELVIDAPHGIKEESPVCQPTFGTSERTIRRIFFMHMRKAGGTTLREYLENVSRHYNLTLDFAEAKKIEIPGNRSDTLYITHLRHPVKRVISHFKYEGRWPCQQLIKNKTLFVPTLENANDFQSFIDKNECGKVGKMIWLCSTNCYIQWLNLGYPQPVLGSDSMICNNDDILGTPDRQTQALTTARRFHLILDVERLFRDINYGSQVEGFFGLPGLVGLKGKMSCGEVSAAANKKNPLVVTNETMNNLYERNAKDVELFEKLTTCDGPLRFPEGSLADFVVTNEQVEVNTMRS